MRNYSDHREILIWRFLLIISSISAVWITIQLSTRVWYELLSPEQWDESVYWAIGRGIVNGLRPYGDLFDEKPPGIFIIAALSHWLTGGRLLGDILQAGVIAGIAWIPPVWFLLTRAKRDTATVMVAYALLISCSLLALFTATKSGEFQTESFGAFFGVLYVLSIVHPSRSPMRVLSSGLALLAAAGMKEPFVLALAGVALFLTPSWKTVLYTFVYPLCVAVCLGFTFMYALGWLEPYLFLVVPDLVLHRSQSAGSLWLQALDVERMRQLSEVLYGFNAPLLLFFYALAFCASETFLRKATAVRLFFFTPCVLLLSFYLTMTAIFAGGSRIYDHHFVLIVPLAFAVMHRGMESVETYSLKTICRILLLLHACLLAAVVQVPIIRPPDHLMANRAWTEPGITSAERIDGVLDACGIDRYLFLGKHGPMPHGYTRHSPIGPFFFQFHYFLRSDVSERHALFRNQLSQANIVVMHSDLELGAMKDETDRYLQAHFTQESPPCAAPHLPLPSAFTMFFRTLTFSSEHPLTPHSPSL